MIESRLPSLCILGILASPVFATAKPGQRDLATEVKAVFQAKCAECHGPQVRKPKGKFGYVLDLKKLAADADKVVPGKPEDSQLWQLVDDDEMPAEGAKAGPLTKEQKQIIHDWIAAGAPSMPIKPSTPSPPTSREPSASSPTSEAVESVPPAKGTKHFLHWLGKFHVLVIHFPIALLLAAALGEVWSALWRIRQPAPAVRFCVLLGALGAIVAAVLGWLLTASGYGLNSPVILAWHRCFGTATAVGSLLLVVLSGIDSRRGVRSWRFRMLLLLVAALVSVAGYFGGRLAYGDDFFNW